MLAESFWYVAMVTEEPAEELATYACRRGGGGREGGREREREGRREREGGRGRDGGGEREEERENERHNAINNWNLHNLNNSRQTVFAKRDQVFSNTTHNT